MTAVDRARRLHLGLIAAFWMLCAATLLWMVGKGSLIVQQRLATGGGTTIDFDVFLQAVGMMREGRSPVCTTGRAWRRRNATPDSRAA